MKKSLYIFILAAAAGLCSILFAVWAVDSEKGNITVTETVVEGDLAAAEGISVELGTHWEGQLLWSTRYEPGRVQEAASSFDFPGQKIRWSDSNPRAWTSSFTESGEVGDWRDRSTAYVDLDVVSTHFGTAANASAGSGSGGVRTEALPYPRLLQAAEDQTAAGETRTVTLRLRDYYEYYPLEFSVAGEDGIVYYVDSWGKLATEFFKLLIPEDEKLQVMIRKDQEGRTIELDCHSTGDGYFPVAASVSGDAGYYFSFYLEGNNKGTEEALGELGGRYAVYWLPVAGQPGKGSKKPQVDLEQMKDAVQLPEGAMPVTMRLDREGHILYLLALQKERYLLLTYSVDGGELTLLQQLTVYDAASDAHTNPVAADGADHTYFRKMTVQKDGILLTWSDNRFAFIARQGEEYRLWCAGIFPAGAGQEAETRDKKTPYSDTDYESAFPYEHAFAFDGTRLALAALERWGSLDSRLLVYREGQLVYSGYYQYSGELDAALGMDKKIIPWGDNFSSHRRQGTSLNPLQVSIE